MDKNQLLELEQYAHLTPAELEASQPALAKPVNERLEARAQREILNRLATSPERLRRVAETIRVPIAAMSRTELRTVALGALREAVAGHPDLAGDNQLIDDLEAFERASVHPVVPGGPAEPTLAETLGLDEPIAFNPEFRRDLDAARIYRVSDAAGVGDATAKVLIDKVGSQAEVSDERLRGLVTAGALPEADAAAAGRAATLYNTLDERPELVAAVKDRVASPRELVKLDQAAWVQIVKDSKTVPPGDISVEAYAGLLAGKAEHLFPTDALAHRLGQVPVGGIAEARKAAPRFPGMRLAAVLDDPELADADKEQEVARRAGLATGFLAENPDVLAADLTPGSPELAGLMFPAGIAPTDRAMVLANARTYQRLIAVADDISDAEALAGGGFGSALMMATTRPEIVSDRSGLSAEKVAKYRDKAKLIASGVTASIGSLLDIYKGRFKDTGVGNVTPAVFDYLKEIPGFADFFGNQDYCACDSCASILSPGAYFVDLMTFVDEHVTQPTFAAKPAHPLKLQNRRPDLWTLQITCENTNTPIPYLVVINEILENAIAKEVGFAGNFANRAAIATAVYRNTLAERVDSFAQPLNLPFEEVRTYLRHFERTLADVAEAAGAEGATLARLWLALPPKDYQLVIQPQATLAFMRQVYGIPFAEVGGQVQKVDAQDLLKAMGVTRSQLGELAASAFATFGGPAIEIKGERRSADSIQNDIENVLGLTLAGLDRLHRFTRLWRATGWRVGELDLVLRHLGGAGIGVGIDAVSVEAVAQLHRIRTRWPVTVEELVALWSTVPQQGIPPAAPLFDRAFNQARFVETGGNYPLPGTSFLHPGLAAAPPVNVDPNLHRLQTGTATDEDGLLQLIVGLAQPLGIDPDSATDPDKQFPLTLRNLSLLYRHARLSRLLRVTIPELFALIAISAEAGRSHVETLADLTALLELHTWWKTTRLSLDALVRILRPRRPAVIASRAVVPSTAGGETVTYTVTIGGQAQPAETVAFTPNADLAAVIAQWNGAAQHTEAYRADQAGTPLPGGSFLAIRTRGAGSDCALEITADSAGLFTAAPPLKRAGANFPPLSVESGTTAAPAGELLDQVRQSGALIFADTAFALMRPLAPVATSQAPVAGVAAGTAVTCAVVRSGGSPVTETITLGAAATLDAVVADWNAKASATRAYRSDPQGAPAPAGTHLSVTVKSGAGSATRLRITTDAAAIFTAAAPLERRGAEITEDQSRAIVAANLGSLELVDAEGRYRLVSSFDPAVAVALPAGLDPTMSGPVQDAFRSYHSRRILLALLPGKSGVAPDLLPGLVALLGTNLDDAEYFAELRGDVPPNRIAALIERLVRLAALFGASPALSPEDLEFIRGHVALFGIADIDRLDLTVVRRVERYRAVATAAAPPENRGATLQAVLLAFDPGTRYQNVDQDALAALVGAPRGVVESMHGRVRLAVTPLEALGQLAAALPLLTWLGLSGTALPLVLSEAYDELVAASAAIQAAFWGKYEDEKEWQNAIEPFRDALLSRRRDGLVAFMVHSSTQPFDEVADLYHYYLLDVQVEGCMRTSRVAAAIDSVQLYVNRILMNLEESPPGTTAADAVHVLPSVIPDDEWEWRQSLRTWVMNRKIFLHPEDYLEPGLRDDKTPLFRTLEEELLSKDVTSEAVLEAYERYLRGFDELAHLTIAGSYHEKDETARRDVLHLFGVTADDPPIYYYRRVEDAQYGAASEDRATHWGAWEKLNIQVPVRKVAPLIHNGQLYVFWVRYVTKVQNKVEDGESKFTGYQHRAYVEFSKRKLDGSWTSPQKLRLTEAPFGPSGFPASFQDDGVVLDPIVPKEGTKKEILWYDFVLYSNFQPLYDNRPHEVPKDDYIPTGFMWDQLYPASSKVMSIRGVNFQMWSPVDLYRMKIGEQYTMASDPATDGVPWLNPAIFILIYALSGGKFDLTALLPPRLVWSRGTAGSRELHTAPSLLPCFDTYTYASLLVQEERYKHYMEQLAATDPTGQPGVWTRPQWGTVITDYLQGITKEDRIGDIPADAALEVVNGSVGDVIIQTGTDAFYLQSEARSDGKYHLRRLTTSVSADIADLLFNRGLETLLATATQLGLKEHPTGLSFDGAKVFDATGVGGLDFNGPMGTYLREIFFHIPFLIANHLNSQGRFAEAEHWYQYIFDPTSDEVIQNLPAGLTPEERRRRELDRNWRYREFRELNPETVRAQLSNAIAIEKYNRDPFNPDAIARLRLSAYQKAILMKYVDNLLDWGDDYFVRAFGEVNPEYLRLATLKYVTAEQILGSRPAELGDCGEDRLRSRTYPELRKRLGDGSEFLMEMESLVTVRTKDGRRRDTLVWVGAVKGARATRALYREVAPAATAPAVDLPRDRAGARALLAAAPARAKETAARFTVADAVITAGKEPRPAKGVTVVNPRDSVARGKVRDWTVTFGWSFVRELTALFCVPNSEKMLGYWDRVADRLYKLRHCQDINGVFRLLPLFPADIDPGLLVSGLAAGLSLDDILASTGSAIPPYRFRYLLDKAKAFTSVVQGFGSALLSALEKRDAEELNKLRNVHQKNILALTTEVRRSELKIAEEGVAQAERRQAGAQYRKDFYQGLISTGLIASESDQYAAHKSAAALKGAAAVLDTLAGIAHLVPQLGSPFAMKYGGLELGSSATSWSQVLGRAAGVAEAVASSRGMDATFERREESWEHQKKLAEHDLKAIEKELAIANLRRTIAERSMLLHEKAAEQHQEIMDYFAGKFSNLGLYTELSRALQLLHREAYNNALALARLAEQAYRFERPGDSATFVGGEWDASRSGLLAGERLLLALHNMERRFLETNTQQGEVNQSFSVAQIAPEALIRLREAGSCEFSIPEFYFDVFYPGQYRRRLRAVRLTVPAITGSYTNISAKLTLLSSRMRRDPALGAAALYEVPANRATSVAMSTGQGDAGVFELNFRDERYMPFEGSGAVSTWRLELPASFRPFEYQSITDVILNLSYTALEDGALRAQVETQNAATEGSLLEYLSNNPATRVFSLRQEFSTAFNRLTAAPVGTPVTIDITDRHFPLFLQGRALAASKVTLVLAVGDRAPVGAVAFTVNGTAAAGFSNPADPPLPSQSFGGLPAKAITAAFGGGLKRQHTISVSDAGNLAALGGGTSLFAPGKLRDVLLVVDYSV